MNKIEIAIIAESARLGDSKSSTPFTFADWSNAVNFITYSSLPGRNDILINQLREKELLLRGVDV